MRKLTPAERDALNFLVLRNGEGAIDRFGSVVCAGVIASRHPHAPPGCQKIFSSGTWLRLMTTGLVEPAGRLRLRVTDEGRAALAANTKE